MFCTLITALIYVQDPAITFFDRLASDGGKLLDQTAKEKSSTTEYSLDALDQLIASEENYYANILLKCLKLCTTAFGRQIRSL